MKLKLLINNKNSVMTGRSKIFLNILMLIPFVIKAQTWTAPAEAKELTAPFVFSDETKKAGEEIYNKNCKSCHGPVGMNAPAPIQPKPIDPASEEFQKQEDGEIFWKVTTGKTPMPTFQAILTEDERWQVISYIRSFNKNYVQPAPTGGTAFKGVKLILGMTYDSVSKKVKVTAMQADKDGKNIPFQGAAINLSVQRLFGKMSIGEAKKTGPDGVAAIEIPADIPGDLEGYIEVQATVNQEGIMAKPVMAKLKAGVPVASAGLYRKHQMWSHKGEGPVWLSLSYGITLAVVWVLIIYVVFLVMKIRKAGTTNDLTT